MNPSNLLNPRRLHTTSDTIGGYLVNTNTDRTLFVAESAEDPETPVFYLETNADPVFAVHDDPKALAEFLADLADVDDDNPFQPSDANLPYSRVFAGLTAFQAATEGLAGMEHWALDLQAAADFALAESVRYAKVTVNMGPDWADTYLPDDADEEDQAAALSRLAAELEAKGLGDVDRAEDEYADEIEATYPDPNDPNGEGFEVEDEVREEIERIVTTVLADSEWQDEPAE